MAWPPRRIQTRRTLRERNQAVISRGLILFAIVIAAMVLLAGRYFPQQTDSLRGAAADVTVPVWSVLNAPVTWLSNAGANISAYWNAAERIKVLQGREQLYLERRVEFEEAVRENRELRQLMNVVDPNRAAVGTFAVSGATSGAYAREALIGGGFRHGVRNGQPVRTASGLIGRTVEVGRNATRVLLVTDSESRVPVRVVRTGLPALVIGTNEPLVRVDLTGPTSNEVQVGDRLVTSGDGGLFAPGVIVATIVEIGDTMPLARPSAVPSLAQYAIVEEPWGTNFEPFPDGEEAQGEAALPSETTPAP
ncbi:MAG: rod shape-determining protein MreC [Pacificimonas sp.]|nr:rod shape-determining protein MreC [Pacificimonas sp.]